MKHSKSGIPRFIMKREADTADKSKPSNERSDCKPSHTTTSVIKDTEAHSERTTDCSESSIAKMTSKTMISTRATKAGRHFVTSSKESLPTHLKVVGGNNSESGIKPASSRTFKSAPPASLANNVAVIGAAPDLKVTNCRLKSLAGGLQVVAAPKSRHTLKTVAVATASGLLQPNLLSYDHDRHNGYVTCVVGNPEDN